MLKVGDKILCDDDSFGIGIVEQIFNTQFEKYQDHHMIVKFEDRELSTMCCFKDMETIFDNVRRKIIKIID